MFHQTQKPQAHRLIFLLLLLWWLGCLKLLYFWKVTKLFSIEDIDMKNKIVNIMIQKLGGGSSGENEDRRVYIHNKNISIQLTKNKHIF